MGLQKVEGYEGFAIFRGDPRQANNSIDAWYQDMLRSVGPAKQRVNLYGADAGLCARRNTLLAHNTWVPSETTSATNAYMRIGVALEEMLRDALQEAGRLLAWNPYLVEIPELKIRGKVDLFIQDQDGELAIVEVKSCGKLPDEPRPTHLIQAQTYAAVSGVHKVWLTYISRNVNAPGETWGPNVSMRSFLVETGTEVLKERLKVAALSLEAIRLRQLPPTPAHFRKHTECHYCEFRDLFCWKPRPGLGEDNPWSPIPEMATDELVRLSRNAASLAESLIQKSQGRRLLTILGLLEDINLPKHLQAFLEKEKDAIYDAMGAKVRAKGSPTRKTQSV